SLRQRMIPFEQLQERVDLLRALLLVVGGERRADAPLEMRLEHVALHASQRGVHGAALREDVHTVPALVDHGADPADLALDARERVELGVVTWMLGHAGTSSVPSIPPWGY